MGKGSKIPWCDDTVNISSGCDGCELWKLGIGGPCYAGNLQETRLSKAFPDKYAADFSEVRLIPGRMQSVASSRDLTGQPRRSKPWLDNRPRHVFVNDLGDIFSDDVPFTYIDDEVMACARGELHPNGATHRYLLLTKRPSRAVEFVDWYLERHERLPRDVWFGASVTNQMTANARLAQLLKLRYRVFGIRLWVSCEPLLDETTLKEWVGALDWVVVGGESRQGAHEPRPFHLAWARKLRDECTGAATEFFMKQMGARPVGQFTEVNFGSNHGDEWNLFPPDLKLRDVPA